ncbi:hypothetical protein [Aliikangiella sp. IMCC44359]|uniref:hypothetical protein n=1 Tax=Aliikangiella sp. IMCC44359 TaxID=3459125 RepID=UPI00403AA0EB
MKLAKIIGILLCSTCYSVNASDIQLADKISDEVVDSLIETYTKFINSNVLSEICESKSYLALNYNSDKVKSDLLARIKTIARERELTEYNDKEIRELTELEFQAFLDGSRYGAFISKNYQIKSSKPTCSPEVMKTLTDSQKDLLDEGIYIVMNRK